MVRKDHHDILCEFHHQDEQASEVPGQPDGYRRFDITVKFAGQPMDEDQYLSLECKFLSVGDRKATGATYATGCNAISMARTRIVMIWACMVGSNVTDRWKRPLILSGPSCVRL